MTVSINGTSGIVFNDASTQNTAATGFGFKNRIINGAMVIDQRNAGAEVNPAVNNTYYVDRWLALSAASGKFKIGRNAGGLTGTNLPAGFTNYLGCTSLSSYSVGASEYFGVRQYIEGFNVADLGWGTANAQTITISFWVRSSLTGTFGVGIINNDATRAYLASYTINSANTWEQKTITVAGDTSGTWLTNNNVGITVTFGMGYGSSLSGTANVWNAGTAFMPTGATSVVGTNGATFYITGVQLEKGSTATSFDYRPYGTELALCQRYAYVMNTDVSNALPVGQGSYATTNTVAIAVPIPVPMRTTPAYSASGSTNPRVVTSTGTFFAVTAFSPFAASTGNQLLMFLTVATTTGGVYNFNLYGGGTVVISAEL